MPSQISSKCFSFDRALNAFVSDVATLDDGMGDVPPPFQRLYDTGTAVGFVMVSHVTGALCPFRLVETRFGKSGDAVAWRFTSEVASVTATVYISNRRVMAGDEQEEPVDVVARPARRPAKALSQLVS